ncbi:MAG TPA: hypothetical protein VK668_02035 [Mucilaginibacter sp.]|nr:hypothetical protein [Mucilaginibacter sp.]
MKLSTFAIIITILAFGFGLAFVFIPVKLMAFYGITLDASGIGLARYFGVSNLFIGMIFWSYSSVSPSAKSWPKLLLYSLIYDILQLIVTLKAQLNNEANSNGWSTVAIFALLAIGSGYFLAQSNKARAQSI